MIAPPRVYADTLNEESNGGVSIFKLDSYFLHAYNNIMHEHVSNVT